MFEKVSIQWKTVVEYVQKVFEQYSEDVRVHKRFWNRFFLHCAKGWVWNIQNHFYCKPKWFLSDEFPVYDLRDEIVNFLEKGKHPLRSLMHDKIQLIGLDILETKLFQSLTSRNYYPYLRHEWQSNRFL